MKIVALKNGKTDKYDQMHCIRSDGTAASTKMPRQGILPHDLLHYVVEVALKYENGFLGMISSGADIAFAMSQTHDISNKNVADQAAHAESIVESLQAQGNSTFLCQCSSPKTATALVVPTNTLPSATVGVMYLLPTPNWSRLPAA